MFHWMYCPAGTRLYQVFQWSTDQTGCVSTLDHSHLWGHQEPEDWTTVCPVRKWSEKKKAFASNSVIFRIVYLNFATKEYASCINLYKKKRKKERKSPTTTKRRTQKKDLLSHKKRTEGETSKWNILERGTLDSRVWGSRNPTTSDMHATLPWRGIVVWRGTSCRWSRRIWVTATLLGNSFKRSANCFTTRLLPTPAFSEVTTRAHDLQNSCVSWVDRRKPTAHDCA